MQTVPMSDLRNILFLLMLSLLSTVVQAQDYTLEKVVQVTRHGVRPPSPDNRQMIETGAGRRWTDWLNQDGELTGMATRRHG